MKDERLSESLRALPRVAARPDFTRTVLESLDASPAPRRGFTGRWVLAAATCAGLAVGAGALWQYQRSTGSDLRHREAAATLAEIRAEHARLRQELDRLSATALPAENGVVYLGGDENVDFVVDLDRVPTAPGGVTAASYRTGRSDRAQGPDSY
jgi:hypothetical protein